MDKNNLIQELKKFRDRLENEVYDAYAQRGSDFGNQRFSTWARQFLKFTEKNLPGSAAELNSIINGGSSYYGSYESDHDVFMRVHGGPCLAFIDSLHIDIENDEYDFDALSEADSPLDPKLPPSGSPISDKVFIVHGHDELLKVRVARFIEKLGLKPIILHEQANQGHTIIEKIEANTDVGFAIILYTEDDVGKSKKEESKNLNYRARQNVVFEHGYLIAKLSRSRIAPLVSGKVEMPSDISGVVYIESANWQIDIAKEMKAAGYAIDFNKVIEH